MLEGIIASMVSLLSRGKLWLWQEKLQFAVLPNLLPCTLLYSALTRSLVLQLQCQCCDQVTMLFVQECALAMSKQVSIKSPLLMFWAFYVLFKVCGPTQPFISPTDLEGSHEQHHAAALQLFRTTRKMGGNVFSQVFEQQLSKQIQEAYENFCKSNSNKNVFNAARTPATLVVFIILAHIVSYFLDFLYLNNLDQMVDLVWWLTVLMLSAWAYVRYSGQYREIGNFVDSTAEFLWEQVSTNLKSIIFSCCMCLVFLPFSHPRDR